MKPNIAITDENLGEICGTLNSLLSDEYVLYTKTRNFHWNVTGPQFNELHEFFEKQYEELNEVVDEVAERVRILGGRAFGSLSEFSGHSRLEEHPGTDILEAKAMLATLLADHETLIQRLRDDVESALKLGDTGTGEFLTGLLQKHEKTAWMLRASLEEGTLPNGKAENARAGDGAGFKRGN